jgi:hypothetical protein
MDQRPRHIADDGSVYEVLEDGRLVPVSVEEARAPERSSKRSSETPPLDGGVSWKSYAAEKD